MTLSPSPEGMYLPMCVFGRGNVCGDVACPPMPELSQGELAGQLLFTLLELREGCVLAQARIRPSVWQASQEESESPGP